MEKPKVLIVGLGLAGSILSFKLNQKGIKVKVVDPNHSKTASKVAGGVWHPMVFKRINKAWMADETIPTVLKTYQEIEKAISRRINYPLEIIKMFPNIQYAQDFDMKSKTEGFSKYIEIKDNALFDSQINTEFGYGTVKIGGRVDLNVMIEGLRKLYLQKELLVEEEFNSEDLKSTQNGFSWKGEEFSKVIFCRGPREPTDYYFGNLPLHRTKGDMLIVKMEDRSYETVVNNGKFIIPIGNDLYKIGSTYHYDSQDLNVFEKDKEHLLEKVDFFLGKKYKVVDHQAGIRPTVSDRRPLIGWHREFSNIGILNGLGTRGVMTAPYCADLLIDNLLSDAIIPSEVNISRFE